MIPTATKPNRFFNIMRLIYPVGIMDGPSIARPSTFQFKKVYTYYSVGYSISTNIIRPFNGLALCTRQPITMGHAARPSPRRSASKFDWAEVVCPPVITEKKETEHSGGTKRNRQAESKNCCCLSLRSAAPRRIFHYLFSFSQMDASICRYTSALVIYRYQNDP